MMMKRTSDFDTVGVRSFYDDTAATYARMMDREIDLPMYRTLLARLHERIAGLDGDLVDTSCGSGQMLAMYHREFEPERFLVAADLSEEMVVLAGERLPESAQRIVADMRDLGAVDEGSAAGVLSFFALHHLPEDQLQETFAGWARLLVENGLLMLATWEGTGLVDYGEEADITAYRYTQADIERHLKAAGFRIERSVVEPVEGLPMDGVYIDASVRREHTTT